MSFTVKERWVYGPGNEIGPYTSLDAAIEDAGRRLRGYTQRKPIAEIFETGVNYWQGFDVPYEKLVATVRVCQ